MSSDSGKYQIPDSEEGGEILPNKLGITDKEELGEAEAEGFANAELEFIEELTDETVFYVAYIRAIHRRLYLTFMNLPVNIAVSICPRETFSLRQLM